MRASPDECHWRQCICQADVSSDNRGGGGQVPDLQFLAPWRSWQRGDNGSDTKTSSIICSFIVAEQTSSYRFAKLRELANRTY
jgi:hypothetical protein